MDIRKAFSRQNLILYGGYSTFFVVCFALAAYLTFPYERVKSVLEERLSTVAPGGVATKLSIGDLGPHLLTGVALEDVTYERKAPEGEPAKVALDGLTLNVSPLSLITGLRLGFGAEIGAGDIDGSYSGGEGEPTHVVAELDAVDLAKLGLGAFAGIPVAGDATGNVDVTLSEKPAETQGDVDLTVERLKLADGKTKVKVPGMAGGLTLETIDAGKLELKLAIKEGVATIERMESKGKDLEMSGSGSIRLSTPFAQSRADITLSVKFDEAYKTRNDRTRAMFDLITQNPMIQPALGPDGTMRFKLTGAIGAMRAAPQGGAAGPAGRKPRGKRAAAPD
jgi:type II secretion system protein N